MELAHKEKVNELKTEWKKLWLERFDDHVRAEGIAAANYSSLYVDRGTVIHATRNFKPIDFKEILERNQVENAERYIEPSPHVGGWSKFIKTAIPKTQSKMRAAQAYCSEKKDAQQPKKGGRGWLHK